MNTDKRESGVDRRASGVGVHPPPTRAPRLARVLIWLATALVIVAHARFGRIEAWCNEASRFATMEALVEHGTFHIEQAWCSAFTVDKAKLGEHFLSTKPPLLSVIGAGVYWVWLRLTGMTFSRDTESTIRFLSLILGTAPFLVLMATFYRLCRLLTSDWWAIACAYASFCLANLMLGYAAGVTNHVPAAMGLLAALYWSHRLRRGLSRGAAAYALAGLAAGLAVAFEHAAAVPAAMLAVYLIWPIRRPGRENEQPQRHRGTEKHKKEHQVSVPLWPCGSFDAQEPPGRSGQRYLTPFAGGVSVRKAVLVALPMALLPVVANFALNYATTGSPAPLFARRELLRYEGSYWNNPGGPDAPHPALPAYLFHMVLGHHGLLSMTPLFILSLIGLAGHLRGGRPYRGEAFLTLAVTAGLLVVYALSPVRNYGGECIGMRWFILAMPLLFAGLVFFVERGMSGRRWAAFGLCFAISALNAFDALHVPWRQGQWDQLWMRLGAGSVPAP